MLIIPVGEKKGKKKKESPRSKKFKMKPDGSDSDSGGDANRNDGDTNKNDDDDDLTLARVSLSVQEFTMAKMYADRALQSNLLSPADQTLADQILAVAHVHTAASQSKKNHRMIHDWYAILQLGDYSHNIFSQDSLSFAYRRLAGLLDPAANRLANASSAFKLVTEAYSVLSDPDKKSPFDSQIRNASASASKSTSLAFWTVCRTCFRVHQYVRGHEGKELTCPSCKKTFLATELPVEPPIVEGTDMYYCTWGCSPIGFPDGYRFREGSREEEKAEATRPPSSAGARRTKQTARKTVRAVNFNMKLRRCGNDPRDDDVDG